MAPPDLDALIERMSRRLAGRTSRRSLLAKLGIALLGAPLLPTLPIRRAQAQGQVPDGASVAPTGDATTGRRGRGVIAMEPTEAATRFARNAQSKDDTKCDYWRYCGMDGHLCTCCGGGTHSCPPGTEPSPVSWVGTCVNPDDGKTYLVAYRDCCGKSSCKRCKCISNDRETPIYESQTDNVVTWCFGTKNTVVHCSLSVLVGPV